MGKRKAYYDVKDPLKNGVTHVAIDENYVWMVYKDGLPCYTDLRPGIKFLPIKEALKQYDFMMGIHPNGE